MVCLNTVGVANLGAVVPYNDGTKQSITNPGGGDPPIIEALYPEDNAINIPANGFQLQVYIEDKEDHKFDWTITTNPDIGSAGQTGDSDGIKTCKLDYKKINCKNTYEWTVWASDGFSENTDTFTFTTDEYIPTTVKITVRVPFDGPTEVEMRTGNVDENVYNWTGLSHKVKIEWQVINEWQSPYNQTVRIRMAEWPQTPPFKLLRFWYTTGMIKIYNPKKDPEHRYPLERFNIIKVNVANESLNPPKYESGVEYLDIELAREQYIEMSYVTIHFRAGIFPNWVWGGLNFDPRDE